MNYIQLRKEREQKYNDLFRECQVFWAFSNQQFNEGLEKHNLKKEDLVTYIGGGFLPKSNVTKLEEGMDTIDKWEEDTIKEFSLVEAHIKYELSNHECWYTGDISDAVNVLPYPEEKVLEVYKKYYSEMTADL